MFVLPITEKKSYFIEFIAYIKSLENAAWTEFSGVALSCDLEAV